MKDDAFFSVLKENKIPLSKTNRDLIIKFYRIIDKNTIDVKRFKKDIIKLAPSKIHCSLLKFF